MATTGYLEKIRATQHYRDIIAAGELYKAIVRAVQAAEIQFLRPYRRATRLQGDWLDFRLTFFVWDLTLCKHSIAAWVQPPKLNDGVVPINSCSTINPWRFRDFLR